MIFKQFYLESLGHASYLVGSEQTGEAFVLDPRRDVEPYLEEARNHGLRIGYGFDTHQHNDYLSGILELEAHTRSKVLVGSKAKLSYAHQAMDHGAKLEMGEVFVEVLHTPGHTPEHISLLITDRSRGNEPTLFLSGGALLVGDIGRPDLLGGEAQTNSLIDASYQTLREKILTLPDFIEVYPTHVAGSLCGGNIASRLSTTLGYERKVSKVLQSLSSIETFKHDAIDAKNLPAIPAYWPKMRKLNCEGPPLLGLLSEPPALRVKAFEALMKEGALVLDCRSPEAFAVHVPGAQNVGFNASFTVWAGSVLPEDKKLLLVLDRPADLWPVCWELLRIGFDLPAGWLSGGMQSWRTSGKEVEILTQWSVQELTHQMEKRKDLFVLDVRQTREFCGGHVQGSHHLPGALIQKKVGEIPRTRPIAVICGSGYRSSIVASFLRREGYSEIANVVGGMTAWRNAGFSVEK